jgi:ribosomal protein L16 Arg81 hydroxylase
VDTELSNYTLQQQKQQQQIKPEWCRRLAEFLAASANQMTDLEDKAALQRFAAYWTRRAEEAERNEGCQNEKK